MMRLTNVDFFLLFSDWKDDYNCGFTLFYPVWNIQSIKIFKCFADVSQNNPFQRVCNYCLSLDVKLNEEKKKMIKTKLKEESRDILLWNL